MNGEDAARDMRLRQEAAEQAAAVRALLEKIQPALQSARPALRPAPTHPYTPYGNARVNPGCIRCPWPRDAHPLEAGR